MMVMTIKRNLFSVFIVTVVNIKECTSRKNILFILCYCCEFVTDYEPGKKALSICEKRTHLLYLQNNLKKDLISNVFYNNFRKTY